MACEMPKRLTEIDLTIIKTKRRAQHQSTTHHLLTKIRTKQDTSN
jgi:hypothetical protein